MQEGLRVGLLSNDLPFSRIASSLQTETSTTEYGLYIDWWRALGASMERSVTFVPCLDNSGCIDLLKKGEVDFIGPAPYVADTALSFTRPVSRRYVFAVSSAGRPVATPHDLNKRAVILVEGAGTELKELLSWEPGALIAASAEEARRRLAAGSAEVAITNRSMSVPGTNAVERRSLWFRWQHIYALANNSDELRRLDLAVDALDPSVARIDRAGLPVGADELLLAFDARPRVGRDALAFLADHPTIRLGASKWEPLTEVKDGRFDGLALRIVSYHLRRAGLTPVYEGENDWSKVKKDARSGLYDGLGFVLANPLSNLEPLLLSEAMIDIPMVVVARSDAEFWVGLEDLADKRLVGNPDYGEMSVLLSEKLVSSFTPTKDPMASLAMLRSGEADAWLEYLPVAKNVISAVGATDVKLAFRFGGPRGASTALRPEWAPILPLIDESIQNTRPEELERIYARWTSRLQSQEASPWLSLLIAVSSTLAVGTLLLARRLGREHRTVRQRERALRRAQLLSGVGSVELRPPYDQVFLDGETSRVLGVSCAEVQRLEQHVEIFTDPERLRQAIEQAKTSVEPMRLDVEIAGDAPQVFTYEITPPRSVDGRRIMIGTIRNVTAERARLAHERELQQQVLHLQKQDAIGQLAGGIAHDFNNILAAIIGYTELALLDIAKGHPARRSLQQVLVASARSRDLVQQILTFSRCDDEKYTAMRLDLCVVKALSLLRASTPATISWTTELSSEPIWVRGDPTQLTQIVVNLVTNAVDAVDGEGTVSVRLSIASEAPAVLKSAGGASFVRLSVTDTGPGVPDSVRHQIFDPFFTTKPRGKGTGLGLSIVHGVVRAHQGHIDVGDVAGGGARFDVLLPTISAPVAEPSTTVEPERGDGGTLLIVDDEPAITRVCRLILERQGFRVTARSSATEALEVLIDSPQAFDLLLTDLTMPKISGVDLAERVRQLNPDLPILLMTGYRADAPTGSEGLFHEVLQKPLTGDQLVQGVRRALLAKEHVDAVAQRA